MPTWPEGYVGSITHTRGWASAAVAPAKDVAGLGIDSEEILSDKRGLKLARRFATENEQLTLTEAFKQPGLAFSLLFSAKESLYKAVFPQSGIQFSFEAVELVSLDSTQRTFRLRCNREIGLGLVAGSEILGHFELGTSLVHTGIEIFAMAMP